MRRALFCLLAMVLPATGQASEILNVSGALTILPTTPPSLIEEAVESDTEIAVVEELSGMMLTAALTVNITGPGSYAGSPSGLGVTDTVAAGERVDFYMLHFDSIDATDGGQTGQVNLSGSITFTAPILGVIADQSELDATDGFVSAIALPTGAAFRAASERNDAFTLSPDMMTLTLDNLRLSSNVLDQMRVVVSAPEPSTASLALLGLVGLAIGGRRRS